MIETEIEAIDLRGVPLRVEKRGEYWRMTGEGKWEGSTLDVFDTYLPSSDVFIDFGGWIGSTSIYASRYCKRVIAFEPDPRARAEFMRNLELNGITSIEVNPLAVAPQEGVAEMWDGGGIGSSVSSLARTIGSSFAVNTITPRQVRAMLRPDETYFVKMDIEGGEYAALETISALFSDRLTGILIAFHPGFIGGRGPGRLLATLPKTLAAFRSFRGFKAYRLTDEGCKRASFREFLARVNLPLFEAKDGYLFVPPGGLDPTVG